MTAVPLFRRDYLPGFCAPLGLGTEKLVNVL
ncbi:MAG: hypothetical protein ACI89X_000844, partial [Planctomycetota bacterium]